MATLRRIVRFSILVLAITLAVTKVTVPRVYAQSPPDLQAEQAAYDDAIQNIEQFRKVPVMVRVLDQTGNPLNNVELDYAEIASDFFMGITGSEWALPSKASAWPLWSDVCGTSNVVQLDWQVWSNTEPQPNVFSWSAADLQFQEVLDHCPNAKFILMFSDLTESPNVPIDPSWVPLNDLTNPKVFQQFKQDLYQYVYNVVQRYSSHVLMWITENELNLPQAQSYLGNSTQRAIEVDQVVVDAIRTADPEARVVLSAGIASSCYAYSNGKCIENYPDAYTFASSTLWTGIKVDGISFEAYPAWSDLGNGSPVFYMSYMEKLATLGLPVLIQETGYPSVVSTCPWGMCWAAWNGLASEELQADWLRYIVTFAFGTANVMGVLWPFGVDPDPALGGPYQGFGLITTGGQPKQDYYTYKQLIQNFTVSGKSQTNSTGETSFRAFAGNYSFEVKGPTGTTGFTVHVDEHCSNEFVLTIGNAPSVTSACSLRQVSFVTSPASSVLIHWSSCAGPGFGNGRSLFLFPSYGSETACYVPSGYTFASWTCTGGLACQASNNPTLVTYTGPGTITLNLKTGSLSNPVSTSLTASASPSNPSHGTSFTVSGMLTAGGSGLGGKQIVLVFGWNENTVTVKTQSDGSYTYTATAPTRVGSYDAQAFFLGDYTGSPQYLPSTATAMVTVN